jgi:hypothetical protein
MPDRTNTLVISAANLVQDGKNNKWVYKFPNSVQFKNHSIAVSQMSIYYSWYNCSVALGNNQFTYSWTKAGVSTTYTVLIPDGLYEIATLNSYLQYCMIANGTYMVNTSLQNVYFAELVVNASRYGVQLNTYMVPTALTGAYAGWAWGTSAAGVVTVAPTQTFNPTLTFPSKFNTIIGYAVGFASDSNINNVAASPTTAAGGTKAAVSGTISYLSTTAPNVQPNSTVLVSLSNVDNAYASPSSVIYAITPNVGIGQLVISQESEYAWNKLIPGTYNELRLTLLGSSDLTPLALNDPSSTILLVIKDNT